MKFRQVTSSKYIGPLDYTLRKSRDGRFSVFKGSTITKWGSNFQTVRSAENFLSQHDYIYASTDTLPISDSDLDFVKSFYRFEELEPGIYTTGSVDLIIPDDFYSSHEVILDTYGKGNNRHELKEVIEDLEVLLEKLDELIQSTSIFSRVVLRGTEFRDKPLEYIFAKKSNGFKKPQERRRSPKEIVRDLVRVKSSNVWAYGIEIKENGDKVGDVYIQFKGKNGGPGDVYRYYDVDLNTWRRVLSYPSKGAAIWKFLRNNFLYSKLTGDKKGKLKNAVNH